MMGFNFLTISIIRAPLSSPRPHLGVLSQRISEVFLGAQEAGAPLEQKSLMLFCAFHFCTLMAVPCARVSRLLILTSSPGGCVCLHLGAFRGGRRSSGASLTAERGSGALQTPLESSLTHSTPELDLTVRPHASISNHSGPSHFTELDRAE